MQDHDFNPSPNELQESDPAPVSRGPGAAVAKLTPAPPPTTDAPLSPSTVFSAKEEVARPFVDDLVDMVIVADQNGRIVFVNEAEEAALGWPRSELVGQPLTVLIPERLRGAHTEAFSRFLSEEPPSHGLAPRRVSALRADGSEVLVNLGFSMAVQREGRRYGIAFVWDLSDQVDVERYRRIADELLTLLAEARGPARQVVPALLQVIAEGLSFDLATAWRWRPETGLLRCEHEWHASRAGLEPLERATVGALIAPGEPLPGMVMVSDKPVWVSEIADYANFRRAAAAAQAGIHSAFAFPIRTRDHFIGVIELFSRVTRQPDKPLDDAVAHLGERFGELVVRLEREEERTRLLGELERARRRQDFLLRASQVLAGTRSLEETIRRLAMVAVPDLGDLCLVDVVGDEGSLARVAAQHADPTRQALADELLHHPPRSEGSHPAALAVRTGRSQWSPEMPPEFMIQTTTTDRHLEVTRLLDFTSFVSVPLLASGRVLGAVTVVSAGSGRRFGAEELTLAEELAGQVASVVERARSYDEQREISGALQRSLLPEDLPAPDGIDLAARYVASNHAAEVGGDFYDVVSLESGRVALCIGDVEGHDMEATATMGQVRSAARAYLQMEERPQEVLALLDHYVERHARRLVTLCLAVLEADGTAVEVASAGHPSPLLASEGVAVGPLPVAPGPPLGIGRAHYPEARFSLPARWALLMYTDGLVEERASGPEGRLAEVTGALARTWQWPLDDVCEAVLATVSNGSSIDDDTAVLAARRQGEGPRRPAPTGRPSP